jgi:hypothetical protein
MSLVDKMGTVYVQIVEDDQTGQLNDRVDSEKITAQPEVNSRLLT